MIYWQNMVRFIRVISRIHLGPDQKRFISQFIKEDVPWQNLILLAQSEGVDGLLYYHLSHLDGILIPTPELNQLKENYLTNRQNRILIEKEAEIISYQLEANGLSALALQGLSLFEIYESPGMRPMGDLDLYEKLSVLEKHVLRLKIKGTVLPSYCSALCIFAIKGARKKVRFLKETIFPREDIRSQINLESNTESRFLQRMNRFVQTLSMVGNGIRQALFHGPFGRH